ncbi:MAG: hypothetical protein R3B93_16590 [Bacteroidia bacterium]
MRIHLIALGVLTSLFVLDIHAQTNSGDKEHTSSFSNFIHHEKLALKLNYFGELGLHPGIEIGTDYTLSSRKWVTVHWDTGLGGYRHRWNNNSMFMRTSIGARLPIWSFFADVNAGIGYMHSFLAGDVYGPDSNGEIEKIRDWGTSHFMPSVSLLLGWDNGRRKNLPFTFHIGPEVYLQSHFNHSFLPHVAVNMGLTYNFQK